MFVCSIGFFMCVFGCLRRFFCVWCEVIFCVVVFVTCINVVLIYYSLVSMFYMDLVFEVYIILMSW